MEIDANINIEIEDSDIVDAVRSELGDFVDSRIDSYDRDNPLHDRMDWDSARDALTTAATDAEVRNLIREIIELNPDVLRPIIAAQVDAAVLYRVQDTVRKEITKWGQSLGIALAMMTHDDNKEIDSE